jgi:hypothetical protein
MMLGAKAHHVVPRPNASSENKNGPLLPNVSDMRPVSYGVISHGGSELFSSGVMSQIDTIYQAYDFVHQPD